MGQAPVDLLGADRRLNWQASLVGMLGSHSVAPKHRLTVLGLEDNLSLFALDLVWAGCSAAGPCDSAGNSYSQQSLLVTAQGLGCRFSFQRKTGL